MMMLMFFVFGLLAFVLASFITFLLGNLVVPFNYYILWLFFGYKRVELYDGEWTFNTPFKTVALFDTEGKFVKAYRYPSTFIGKVTLNEDGTAEYCGRYKWKFI